MRGLETVDLSMKALLTGGMVEPTRSPKFGWVPRACRSTAATEERGAEARRAQPAWRALRSVRGRRGQ
jgi:hypothetical protein